MFGGYLCGIAKTSQGGFLGHRTVAQYLQKVSSSRLYVPHLNRSCIVLSWLYSYFACFVSLCVVFIRTLVCQDLLAPETEICAELPNALCRSKCSLANHHQDLGRKCKSFHFCLCACLSNSAHCRRLLRHSARNVARRRPDMQEVSAVRYSSPLSLISLVTDDRPVLMEMLQLSSCPGPPSAGQAKLAVPTGRMRFGAQTPMFFDSTGIA